MGGFLLTWRSLIVLFSELPLFYIYKLIMFTVGSSFHKQKWNWSY